MKKRRQFIFAALYLSGCIFVSCITPYQGDGASQSTPAASVFGQIDYQGPGRVSLHFFFSMRDGTYRNVRNNNSYGLGKHGIDDLPLGPGEYLVVATTARYTSDASLTDKNAQPDRLMARITIPSGRMLGHRRLIYIGTLHLTYINNQLTSTVTDDFEETQKKFADDPRSGFARPDLEKEILKWE